MEPPNRPDGPRNLPAVPPPPAPPAHRPPDPGPWATGRQRVPGGGPPPTPPSWLRRLRPRSVRLAVGLGILGAAVLLYPFAAMASPEEPYQWWLPIGLGVGSLALITLLRLDRLLFGWALHVGGLVLVGALIWQTSFNPWSWGLAIGIGIVIAGLLLLPRWQVLAAGMMVLVVAGVGFGLRTVQLTDEKNENFAKGGDVPRPFIAVSRPQLGIVSLDNGVRDNDWQKICRLVQDRARDQIQLATGAADCVDAVARLHERAAGSSKSPQQPNRERDPILAPGQTTTVDACSTLWADVAGPGLGRVLLLRTEAAQPRYLIAGFVPC